MKFLTLFLVFLLPLKLMAQTLPYAHYEIQDIDAGTINFELKAIGDQVLAKGLMEMVKKDFASFHDVEVGAINPPLFGIFTHLSTQVEIESKKRILCIINIHVRENVKDRYVCSGMSSNPDHSWNLSSYPENEATGTLREIE